MEEIRQATLGDKAVIVSLLAASFDDNQSVNFTVLQDKNRLRRIQALMEYSFDMCNLFGEVWLTNDEKACGLILYPHQKKTTFKSIGLDIKLMAGAVGYAGLAKVLNREVQIKMKQPKDDMLYLWFIGVDISHQHTGIGTQLLQKVILEAEAKKLPVYLETSDLKNVSWYEHFGFEVYDKLEIGYTLYFLRRLSDL